MNDKSGGNTVKALPKIRFHSENFFTYEEIKSKVVYVCGTTKCFSAMRIEF